MILDDYVTLVATRCQVDDGVDPEAAHVAACVKQAVATYQAANRRGFDFLRRDVTLTTIAGQQTYSFAAIAALVADNDPDVLYPVRRVYTANLRTSAGPQQPLERVSRLEAEADVGAAFPSQLPARWTAEGRTLYLYPSPTSAVDVALRVLLTDSVDVATGTVAPLLPDEYQGVVVELASSYVYRDLRDRVRAGDAMAAYKLELQAALTDMPYGGPGRPTYEPR